MERITVAGTSTRKTDTGAELVVDVHRGGGARFQIVTHGGRGGRHVAGIIVSAEHRDAILRLLGAETSGSDRGTD